MNLRWRRNILMLALLAATACHRRPDPLPGLPRIFLWAWEHPEHLTFLDPHTVGVAFLARSVSWHGRDVTSTPRFQPLEIPPGASVIAVIRLESQAPPLPDPGVIVSEILKAAQLPRLKAIQIDFDARLSERQWYADLLHRLRAQLNPALPLTITALASWCLGDPHSSTNWIRRLPVTDAIPMMFRMGVANPRPVVDFSFDVCRSSVGISTDEIAPAIPHGRRVFIFHPGPWTPAAYRGAIEMARRLQ